MLDMLKHSSAYLKLLPSRLSNVSLNSTGCKASDDMRTDPADSTVQITRSEDTPELPATFQRRSGIISFFSKVFGLNYKNFSRRNSREDKAGVEQLRLASKSKRNTIKKKCWNNVKSKIGIELPQDQCGLLTSPASLSPPRAPGPKGLDREASSGALSGDQYKDPGYSSMVSPSPDGIAAAPAEQGAATRDTKQSKAEADPIANTIDEILEMYRRSDSTDSSSRTSSEDSLAVPTDEVMYNFMVRRLGYGGPRPAPKPRSSPRDSEGLDVLCSADSEDVKREHVVNEEDSGSWTDGSLPSLDSSLSLGAGNRTSEEHLED